MSCANRRAIGSTVCRTSYTPLVRITLDDGGTVPLPAGIERDYLDDALQMIEKATLDEESEDAVEFELGRCMETNNRLTVADRRRPNLRRQFTVFLCRETWQESLQ